MIALPESNQLTLLGTGLTIGSARRIYFTSARWRQRLPGVERVLVDPSLPANASAGWAIVEASDSIRLTLGTGLTVDTPSGLVLLPVEPGVYSVVVEVVKDSLVVMGQLKEITDVSNPANFAVIPRVLGATVTDATNRVIRVTLDTSTDLTPAGSSGPLDLLFVANGQNYLRHDPTDPSATFDPGDFQPTGDSLEFRALFDPTVSGAYPMRVIVEGAENQPFWMEIP
jgi:hypothetical protein